MSADVSPVFLVRGSTDELVAAELRDGIEDLDLQHWEHNWRPYLIERVKAMQAQGVQREKWPQQLHWNWRLKASVAEMFLGQRGFAIRCEGMTQGLMLVGLVSDARIDEQRGKPLVYVDYLEAAPWNQSTLQRPPKYRLVGSLLMRAAVSLSLEETFGGRTGLHSLPQSDRFYRDVCGMTDLGPDAAKQNLRYFEMTPDQAQAFLKGGK